MSDPIVQSHQAVREATDRSMLGLVVEQARRFAAREIDPIAFDRAAQLPRRVLKAAAEAGLFGLAIPESYGGLALSLGDICQVVSELATRDGSFATSIGLHNGLGTRGLIAYGSQSLKEKWLPKLASGEAIASFAATETGAGSDLMAIRTTLTPRGEQVRLDGEKSYVTNGGFAGLYTVLARSPEMGGARAHSLVCVPRDTPGVEVGAEEHKMGLRGSSTVTVSFDGVMLPMENVLGTSGQGIAYAQHILTWGRTIMASGCIGAARNALNAVLSYVIERKQFGRSIGHFGASRAHVATMAAKLWAMEAMVERTGIEDINGGSIDGISGATKVFCSDEAFDICDRAIQLHGALGFLSDLGVERLLRDARVTRIFEGANDVILVFAGTALIALSRSDAGRRCHATVEPDLEEVARAWERVEQELQESLDRVRKKYGVKAIRHQLVLQRLARAHIALQAASASLWRARAVDAVARSVARLSVQQLLATAKENLSTLESSEIDESNHLQVTEALYRLGAMPQPVRA
ncbi:MAG: acyl-CoA dehydrogenase family protein [Deltaproteobacteria bacterium]|nr:acyl-CoA dehydrogenase family protein [Deltaproteobacteria bacterium]